MAAHLTPLLTATKAPFLFSIIAGALAWTLVHLVERSTGTPLLEVRRSSAVTEEMQYVPCGKDTTVRKSAQAVVRYRLTNLSRSSRISDLAGNVQLGMGGAQVVGVRLKAEPPTGRSTEPEKCDGLSATFKDQVLHPEGVVELAVVLSSLPEPSQDTAFVVLNAKEPVLTREPGVTTFLIRHEIVLLASIAMALSILLVGHLVVIRT